MFTRSNGTHGAMFDAFGRLGVLEARGWSRLRSSTTLAGGSSKPRWASGWTGARDRSRTREHRARRRGLVQQLRRPGHVRDLIHHDRDRERHAESMKATFPTVALVGYSATRAPSSTTRPGGMPNTSVAGGTLREITSNSRLRQPATLPGPVDRKCSRPTK